jgi:hypothetical protein
LRISCVAHDLRALAAITERRQVLRLLAGASLHPVFRLWLGRNEQQHGRQRRERRRRSRRNGWAAQLASVTGNASDGFVATLTVGVAR